MNKVILEDMEYINTQVEHNGLDGRRVLVSGATGLIGKYLVRFLAQYCHCTVLVVVRDKKKAQALWEEFGEQIQYICSDITKLEVASVDVDYIIHAASITSSRSFSMEPVETIWTSVEGTRRMLEFAKKNPVRGFVFLSTMEVYGTPSTDDKIRENYGTNLDTMSARNSYPESKRLCESMCTAYFSEYGVPVRVLRLTQTFGPGAAYGDTRVCAEFARCAIEGRDIVLHTKGETKRNYLYLADACTAILTVLTKGASGEAYNGANEDTYCSIKAMAELVAASCSEQGIRVRVEQEEAAAEKFGYAPVLRMNLDTSKLQKLGWKPRIGLADMYQRTIRSMTEDREGV